MVEEAITINTVLQELREFRVENNKRWDQNEKRWEENDKRWEQNEKRWEQNDKRWEQNEKRWEENNKRWEQNEKRWEENKKRWEQNEKRWKENDQKLETINARVTKIENSRESDKKEFARVFEAIEESIIEQFEHLNKKIDIKFSKVDAIFADLGLEVKDLQETAKKNETKINLHDVRIEKLEDWKEELDIGGLVPA